MVTSELLAKHRGPFQLIGTRRTFKGHETCMLSKNTSRDEVLELVESFLTDPRDTLVSVTVWAGVEPYCIGWTSIQECMREEQDK